MKYFRIACYRVSQLLSLASRAEAGIEEAKRRVSLLPFDLCLLTCFWLRNRFFGYSLGDISFNHVPGLDVIEVFQRNSAFHA